jgi:hypothetical protein
LKIVESLGVVDPDEQIVEERDVATA